MALRCSCGGLIPCEEEEEEVEVEVEVEDKEEEESNLQEHECDWVQLLHRRRQAHHLQAKIRAV